MMYALRNPIAAALLLALILVGGSTGFGWWLAARDRDAARAELVAERELSAKYRGAIAEQNRAVDALVALKASADERGLAAKRLADANGKRLDLALAQSAGQRATTCAEAMPVVNAALEAVR